MKKYFKILLDTIFSPVANRMGYKKTNFDQPELNIDSKPYYTNNPLSNFFEILQQINFLPGHIVDVGANHGTWTRQALKYFPQAFFTLIEPQCHLQASIIDILETNPKVKFHAVGAGNKSGSFMFTIVDRDDSCSFKYSTEEAVSRGFFQIEVPLVTLNDFLTAIDLPMPDLIKIDAEGLDMEVLSGANNFFGKTEIFMVEASVMCKSYDNSVLKIIAFMDENGYRLFDITDLNRTQIHGALWLVELVFIKKEGHIDKAIFSYN